MSQIPRSLLLFEESYKSEQSKKSYKYYLDRFLKWADKDYDTLLQLTYEELDILIQDYLFYLKKRINPNSLSVHFCAIDKFLMLNDKNYNKRKLKALFPEKVKPSGEKAWATEDIKLMLDYADNKRAKALIHVLAACGCRIGALEDFKLKHISEMLGGCLTITLYQDSKWEYTTFLHQETADAIKKYHEERKSRGELLTPESFVFSNNRFIVNEKNPKGLTVRGLTQILENLLPMVNIRRKKQGNRYDVQIANGFRKRFNTILKTNPNISYAIAERLMDHRTNLEQSYLYTPTKVLFEHYSKAIKDLIIDESERLKLKNQELEKEKSEIEKKNEELTDALQKVDELWADKKRMENKNS